MASRSAVTKDLAYARRDVIPDGLRVVGGGGGRRPPEDVTHLGTRIALKLLARTPAEATFRQPSKAGVMGDRCLDAEAD